MDRSVTLEIAIEGLDRARLILRSHEAALEMAQAQVNGLRTRVGKAAFRVRCAGGYA